MARATAPPEPPSPMTVAISGTPRRRQRLGRAGDSLGLAALLRADAGIGAGGIDQGDDRQLEALGQVHQADRLAVAFRLRHAEVVLDAAFRVVALLVPDDHDRAAAEPRRGRP